MSSLAVFFPLSLCLKKKLEVFFTDFVTISFPDNCYSCIWVLLAYVWNIRHNCGVVPYLLLCRIGWKLKYFVLSTLLFLLTSYSCSLFSAGLSFIILNSTFQNSYNICFLPIDGETKGLGSPTFLTGRA